jgi:hypothetical protein
MHPVKRRTGMGGRRAKAFEAVNVALIETYRSIGEQLSRNVT